MLSQPPVSRVAVSSTYHERPSAASVLMPSQYIRDASEVLTAMPGWYVAGVIALCVTMIAFPAPPPVSR